MNFLRPIFVGTSISLLLWSGLSAQIILIDENTRNGSFELLNGNPGGSEKATAWDNDPDNVDAGVFNNVDNWTWLSGSAPSSPNSGTEVIVPAATEGTKIGFIQPGTGVRNVTSQVISVGQVYSWSFDYTDANRGGLIAGLGYWDGSSFTTIAAASTQWFDDDDTTSETVPSTQNDSWVVTAGAWVGQQVGFYFEDVTTGPGTYPEFDNVVLTVVPEPSSFAAILGGLALCLGLARRRR